MKDPIVEELHRWREEHARSFNYRHIEWRKLSLSAAGGKGCPADGEARYRRRGKS